MQIGHCNLELWGICGSPKAPVVQLIMLSGQKGVFCNLYFIYCSIYTFDNLQFVIFLL